MLKVKTKIVKTKQNIRLFKKNDLRVTFSEIHVKLKFIIGLYFVWCSTSLSSYKLSHVYYVLDHTGTHTALILFVPSTFGRQILVHTAFPPLLFLYALALLFKFIEFLA
jgi:hypothetical protein